MNYFKCEYFKIQELVDRNTYEKWGEAAWMFLRPEALYSLDGIRKYFNKRVFVNNWAFGGDFQWRGLRPPTCTVGVWYSQHRFGNGFDCDVEGVTADEVRGEIVTNENHPLFTHITCLETDITYVHLDCRNIENRIRLVKGL